MLSGVGLVGPVLLNFRYRGTEVRVTPFEGKRIPVRFFRIASRPAIRKEDLFYLRINAVEQAQDETKQAILKQEDARLLVILQAAVTDYATRPDHVVTPNHNIWKPVPGWEGFYEVQGWGQVRSLLRKTVTGLRGGRVLSQSINSNTGYPMVTLSRPGFRRTYEVHALVAAAFIGELPKGMYVCHNDRVKAHNWAGNLRHDTPEGNARDEVGAGAHWNTRKEFCPKCGGPFSERPDGTGRRCDPCKVNAVRAWRQANPERARELARNGQRAYRARQKAIAGAGDTE